MSLDAKLKKLRKSSGHTQAEIANALNIQRQTYGAYERGISTPDANTLKKLAKIFNVSIDVILDQSSESSGIKIPVLGYIRAGLPITAVENIIDYEEISSEMASTGEFFALCVMGDSMEPRICEGDVVVVKKQTTCNSGDIAIVLVNGEEATIKKVLFRGDSIILVPFNKLYESKIYSPKMIKDYPIEILGKVVELRAKL